MIPNKLQKGDTIGVISPSSPLLESKLEDINKSKTLMENYGFKGKFAKNAFSNTLGYSATVKEKVDDIHEMFLDKEVKAIFSSTGGNNSSSLFEYLDYEIIKNNPKIICGFSDFTSLTNIIYQKTGLVTFNGATLKSLTSWETDYGYKEVIKRFCKDDLSLGQDDDEYISASFLLTLVNKAPDIIDNRYAWWAINDLRRKGYFMRNARQAVNQTNFNGELLAQTKISVPSLDTQLDIIAKLEEEIFIVKQNKRLIAIFEQKIEDKISEIWGEKQ